MPTQRAPRAVCCIGLSLCGFALGPAWGSTPAAGDPELWPAGTHFPLDAETGALVDKLLAQMSLEDKVGQMIQADIASITPADLQRYPLGSILAGGNAAPGNDIHSTPQAWLSLTDEFHGAALASGTPGHPGIPILFGIDAVHGHAKLVGATIFPHNVALGAAHDPDLIYRIGEATAQEVAATGIDWTFAPTVAVARDVRWGRSYESYSESPELVAEYAGAMVSGLQGLRGTPQFMSAGHTLSSVKHFLGDGGTTNGRDQGDTILGEAELAAVHGAGYASAIRAGALIVMASYNSWNGEKLHAQHYLLTDVLKGRMAFDGFVVGDWDAHEQIPGCTKYDCPAAVNAGIDMLMAPDSWKELYRNTLAEARSGKISEARIDEAVRRILRVKAVAGVLGHGNTPARSEAGRFAEIGSAAHRAIAREAVRKSLVLLKNHRDLLPLNPHSAVLVAGDAADDIGMQCGGWTVDWQGNHNTNTDFPGATSIYAGIRAAVTAAGGSARLSRDGVFQRKPDVAIVVFGERPYAEFQGDRETLEFSAGDQHELLLLRRLRRQGVPTVSVFLSGRPLWVNPEINASDAFVAAWLPGSEGEGIADVLFRAADGSVAYDFTGRSSFSWPRTAMPVKFAADGYASGALFPRGSGLDYRVHSELPRLSENARIPPEWRAPAGSLFHAAHATAPWSLFVADAGDQVHVTTDRQASPHQALNVTLEASGAHVAWSGSREGVFLISGRAENLEGAARRGGALELRFRVDSAPEHEVQLRMPCSSQAPCASTAGAALDLTAVFEAAPRGVWRDLRIPLSCWSAAGADLKDVEVPFAVATAGKFAMTIAEARLAPRRAGAGVRCP
jgi:beta-glucosidase